MLYAVSYKKSAKGTEVNHTFPPISITYTFIILCDQFILPLLWNYLNLNTRGSV